MTTLIRFVCLSIALATFDAMATAQRTFAASNGSDSNPCSLTAPCRSFATAVAQTTAGGEVIVLDSAGYGAVTIAKSVSIIAPPGIYAGISVFSGAGVAINDPNAVVVLRGLSINGQGGLSGIDIGAATEVHVENVTVSNMQGAGIFMNTAAVLLVKDSIVRDCAGHGIQIQGGTATLSNVRSDRNQGSGVYASTASVNIVGGTFDHNGAHGVRGDSSKIQAMRATMSSNAQNGVLALGAPNTASYMMLDECAVDGNGSDGVFASGNVAAQAYVRVNGGHIADNAGAGVKPNASGEFVLNGSALRDNAQGDVDPATGSVLTYQNNAIGAVLGPTVPLTLR